jgi:protein phosphatase PTC1
VDHVATDQTEVQRVCAAGGQVINNRVGGSLAVTRALGDHCLKDGGVTAEPHYVMHTLEARDRFLLMASDGVWDVLSDADASELVLMHQHESGEELANRVIKLALARNTRDNLSCLVIRLQ